MTFGPLKCMYLRNTRGEYEIGQSCLSKMKNEVRYENEKVSDCISDALVLVQEATGAML